MSELDDRLLGSRLVGTEWVLQAVLGRGQAGRVYQAQGANGGSIAVKVPAVPLAADPTAMQRFTREATALAQLRHPGVVRGFGVGATCDGRPALLMEFIAGQSLESILCAGPLPPTRVAALAISLADALAYSHWNGILHRDLKPENVMIADAGTADERPVLVDFGVVLPLLGPAATRLTADAALVGTPYYMAPEQVAGDELTGAADVYSLGVMMYRMLTGKLPFSGTLIQVIVAHAEAEPPALPASIPQPLRDAVAACLCKSPAHRPSPSQLVAALRPLARPSAGARPPFGGRLPSIYGAALPAALSAAKPRIHPPPRAAPRVLAKQERGTCHNCLKPIVHPPSAPSSPHRRRRRTLTGKRVAVSSAVASMLVAAIALAMLPSVHGKAQATPKVASVGGGEPSMSPLPLTDARRVVMQTDALASVRVSLPAAVTVGQRVDVDIELWTDDGVPIISPDVVVTVEDGSEPHGYAARLRGSTYRVFHRFRNAGTARLRVFPPNGASSFVLEIDVSASTRKSV